MMRLGLVLFIMLYIYGLSAFTYNREADILRYYPIEVKSISDKSSADTLTGEAEDGAYGLTPMEALDKVKEMYASNFDKVILADSPGDYYYKLDSADYYLVYEGPEDDENYYLIHLYEFVLDDPEEGIGHTVTYGWYAVDKRSGEVIDRIGGIRN